MSIEHVEERGVFFNPSPSKHHGASRGLYVVGYVLSQSAQVKRFSQGDGSATAAATTSPSAAAAVTAVHSVPSLILTAADSDLNLPLDQLEAGFTR